MARPKNDKPRALGPYPNRAGFRVIFVKRGGERDAVCYPTEDEALDAIAKLNEELHRPEKTIREALKDYEAYMREEKGNKANSIDQTQRKLVRFFDVLDVELKSLSPERCEALYVALRTSKCKPQKPGTLPGPAAKTISVDYHRNALSEAKTFLRWCVKRKLLPTNPLEDVEGIGKRNHGKEQLRIDEARLWIASAVECAEKGEDGAVAAMMTLLLGMRCSEVISRVARDVDDQGRLLWIPDSKTRKGRRTLEVPEALRPFLQELAKGKKTDELLFGHRDRGWPRAWVKRICDRAGVTEVTAHGQRGLHGTLAVAAGITAHAVADALGHESFRTTAQSYAQPEAVGRAAQARTLKVLDGGKTKERAA